MTLTGNFFSDTFTYLQVKITPCVSSPTQNCKSQKQAVDFWSQNNKMQFMYNDSYIDTETFDFIVHNFVNDELFLSLDPTQSLNADMYIQQRLTQNQDDDSDSYNSTTISRTSIQQIAYATGLDLITVTLRMDSSLDFTSFRRYDFETQVGTVGGNKDFIAMFIFLFLNYFTDIDYLCCIVKSLFLKKQTQTEFLERRT